MPHNVTPPGNSTTLSFQVGTYNSTNDTFTLVYDMNDRTNTFMHADSFKIPDPEKVDSRSFNIRTPGEAIVQTQYKNRHITYSFFIRSATSGQDAWSRLHTFLASIDTIPFYLRIALPGAANYSYARVVKVTKDVPTEPPVTLAKTIRNITVDFECDPGLYGDRIVLTNDQTNPGFENPSGPGVTVFNESFANTNAYTNIAGSAISGNDTNTFADAVQTLHPLRYYRLNEASGTTAFDVMHNGDGTLAGGVTQGVAGALASDTDTANTFNGTTGTISLPTSGLPTGNAAWSIAAWCKFASNPAANAMIAAFGNNATKSDALLYINSTGHAVVDSNAGPASTSTAALSTAAYHFVVGTWDGSTMALYVDGASTGTPAGSGPLTLAGGYARIAAWQSTAAGFFSGQIDEVQIYNYALTSGNVTTLYNAGHNAPTTNSASFNVPSGNTSSFGSSAWGAVNQLQMRFRYVSTLVPSMYLHRVDSSNYILVQYNNSAGGTWGIFHDIATVTTTLASQTGVKLVLGAKYWFTITQYPFATGDKPLLVATIAPDSAGAPGTAVATAGFVAANSTTIALSGIPAIMAGNATMAVDKVSMQLFGPGGWWLVSTGAGTASGVWDGAQLGATLSNSNTYSGGVFASNGAARITAAPAGALNAAWRGGDPTSLTTLQQTAIPVKTATNVLAFSVYYKTSGVGSGCVESVYFTEYDSTGALLRTGSNAASNTGSQASYTLMSGTYTTGANCAYALPFLSAVDATSGSVNGSVFWDSFQAWDQTDTGQTSMNYCETNFNQAHGQVLLTGITGELPAPANVAMGVYESLYPANISYTLGRRPIVTTNPQSVEIWPVNNGVISIIQALSIDATAYGGFTVNTTGSTLTSQIVGATDAQGTFHFYVRGELATGTPATAGVSLEVGDTIGSFGHSYLSANVYPFASTSVWYAVDLGEYAFPFVAANSEGNIAASTIFYQLEHSDATQRIYDHFALMPNDGDLLILNIATNAYTGLSASGWISVYADGTTYSYLFSKDAQFLANFAASSMSSTATGVTNNNPQVYSAGSPALYLDPAQSNANASGCAVMTLMVNDSNVAMQPVRMRFHYSPQWLQPRT